MSDIQLYLLEADKNRPEARRIAAQSAKSLESKALKLIDLITTLEPYINNKEDGEQRAKCVAYLADVLESVPPKVLTLQERRLLSDFILGRIEGDVEGIGASARALMALEDRGKWDSETAQKVGKTFLDHTNPVKRFRLQTDRFAVIQLFDVLFAKYREPMKQLAQDDPEFLANFISYFEGEKDPRNLMIVFSILQVPMAEWDIHTHAQDLFDSVFNYFPITFKPPPDDPYGITAQDLKDRLRDCIASNSSFAPFSFPALLDKLDSTSMNTKRDVLQTIQACVIGYEPKTVNLYSITLWDALKFEILNVQEEDLAEDSLKALALIGAKFSELEGPLNSFLRPITKECNEHLEDAPTKQSEAAGRMLYAVAVSGLVVADKAARGVLPVLFNLYRSSESIAKRRGLLEVYNQFLKAYIDIAASKNAPNAEALHDSANEALEAMLRAVVSAPKSEVSFRLAALEGIAQMLAIPKLLTEKDIIQAVDSVTGIILHEPPHSYGDIRPEAIRALTKMAKTAPHVVRNHAIPAFMVELPDAPTGEASFGPILEAFAQLSSEQQVFDTVVLRLKNKFNAARQQGASKAYQHGLLLATLYAFSNGAPMPDEYLNIRNSYFSEHVEPLIMMMQTDSGMLQDAKAVEIIGSICNIILRPQSPHFQASVYNRNLDWISPAKSSGNASADHIRHLAPFSMHFYAALRPEVVDPEDILSLLKAQADFLLAAPEKQPGTHLVLDHLTLLINKFLEPKAMQSTLAAANLEPTTLLATPDPQPLHAATAFAVTRALILLGKTPALTTSYLNHLLTLPTHPPATSTPTAHLFPTLLAPTTLLSKANHCPLSPLAKQKTISITLPTLLTSLQNTTDPTTAPTKPAHLTALAGLLRHAPFDMLTQHLPALIPALLQTLDLPLPATGPTSDIKPTTLHLLHATLTSTPSLLAPHTPALIARLLNCTSISTHPATAGNSPEVRRAALRCLALVPAAVERAKVVGVQRQVVKRLMGCLDDGRRGVRAEAVRCRTAWLAVGEEDGKE